MVQTTMTTDEHRLKRLRSWADDVKHARRAPSLQHLRIKTTPHAVASYPSADTRGKAKHEHVPHTKPIQVVGSDLGITSRKDWRPMRGTGHIHAIETITGEAIATDGVLIAIRLPSGEIVLGHLDNWVYDVTETTERSEPKPSRRRTILDLLMA